MPHDDVLRGLRIDLATALRERDAALAQEVYWHNRATEARDEAEKLRADVKRLWDRDDAARAMLTQLRAALSDDSTFLGAVLRVEMDKWLASGGDRG